MNSSIEVYKCLAHEARLSIVRELIRRREEVAGSQILGSCSMALNLAQPTLSQHFSRLVRAGVLQESKRGVEKYYRVDVEVLERASINVKALIKEREDGKKENN